MIWNKLRIPLILLIIVAALLTSLGLTTFISGNAKYDSSTNLTKIGGYTTYYQSSSPERKQNIKLASTSLNNIVVAPNETISFNAIVGAREEKRGYKPALIISKGEYVVGVGGGVCQVSTTLYNAWITSGLEAVEVHAHSLPSNYVPLSRDAMVSSNSDMLLKNNQSTPVMISCNYTDTALSIKIFGSSQEYEYNIVSIKLKELVSNAPIYTYIVDPIKQGQHDITFKGSVGYMSKAILQRLKNGVILDEKEIRQDYYIPLPMKITVYTEVLIEPTTPIVP